MKLRYGVIGAGVVAPLHLEAIAALGDVELVGISALVPEEVAPLAAEAGCPWFVDHRELLARAPDVVVVCTPHPSHPMLTIAALEAGAHVLVEKPLAVEVREADEMIDAAGRAGRTLGVCFQQRFRPVIAAAHALIADGRVGELIRASIVDPLYRPNACYGTAAWRGTWSGEGGGARSQSRRRTRRLLCSNTRTGQSERLRCRPRSRECSGSRSSATAAGSRSSARRSPRIVSSRPCRRTFEPQRGCSTRP